ncbi:MAG: hypothetical protein ACOC8H_01040 [bacterium]
MADDSCSESPTPDQVTEATLDKENANWEVGFAVVLPVPDADEETRSGGAEKTARRDRRALWNEVKSAGFERHTVLGRIIRNPGTEHERADHEYTLVIPRITKVDLVDLLRRLSRACSYLAVVWANRSEGIWTVWPDDAWQKGEDDVTVEGVVRQCNLVRNSRLVSADHRVEFVGIEYSPSGWMDGLGWQARLRSLCELKAREQQDQLLGEHLKLIPEHSPEILKSERYFYCYAGNAYLSIGGYIGPEGAIPLGVLVLLWQDGKLLDKCQDCGGTVHIIGTAGDHIPGTHRWWGYCTECGRYQEGAKATFEELRDPLRQLLREHCNEPVIERGERPRFSWSKGLVGERTPDRIIKPKIEGVSVTTLIRELKEKDGLGEKNA